MALPESDGMNDLLFVAVLAAFFGLAALYVRFCERL